jgi:hypothetical protein
MRRLKNVGKQATRVCTELNVCDVRCIGEGITHVALQWERGAHVISTRVTAVEIRERLARFNCHLRMNATLYRSSRSGFASKPSMLRLLDRTPGAQAAVMGEMELDLASFEPGTPALVKQLRLKPPGRGGASTSLLLQLTVECTQADDPHAGDAPAEEDFDGGSSVGAPESVGTSSRASMALTADALAALEIEQRSGKAGGKPARGRSASMMNPDGKKWGGARTQAL